MIRERWSDLCRRVGCASLLERFGALDRAYRESHRAYHTWTHVAECLDVWGQCPEEVRHPEELELAIFLHDAVYRPLRADNEARSAELAVAWIADCPERSFAPGSVRGLILATKHPAAPTTSDEALIRDIDLHVLGAPPARYREYELQVRREYRLVPSPLFRRRRTELLASLLDSGPLFHTPWFRERFETRARANLAGAIERLGRGDA